MDVVSDSSPLIYLTRIGQFGLLRLMHKEIAVPDAVWNEVAIGGVGRPESLNLTSRDGHLSEVKPFLNRLAADTNFRISGDLYDRALRLAGEN